MMIAFVKPEENTAQKELILFGLERGNLVRLQEGKPMRICQETHPGFPLANVEIVIFFGETPRDLVETIKPFMDENTKVVHVQPPGQGKVPS